MIRLLAVSVFGLVYLTLTAHCDVVKRSAPSCTYDVAKEYCNMYIRSSRNPTAKCEDGAVVCYMTSTKCSSAAGCEDACRPLANPDISVQPQCVSSQCRCRVSGQCTQSNCEERCVTESKGKRTESSECLPNNTCICNYFDPCIGETDCRSVCEQQYPGKNFTVTQCGSDEKCFCEYEGACMAESDCKHGCEKAYPGKTMLSTKCGRDKQCLCSYLDGGTGTALRPCVLTIAIILLTISAMIPAPAEGKVGALLISSTMFGFFISQLASS